MQLIKPTELKNSELRRQRGKGASWDAAATQHARGQSSLGEASTNVQTATWSAPSPLGEPTVQAARVSLSSQ